ncbi:Glycosyl_transferases group [Hexamita inflata]|uniref:Glycosyl_transferases group n=1 Tax=Hexamita inflata TaxID=28002 RepID=A0ABP1LN16_9EUKA
MLGLIFSVQYVNNSQYIAQTSNTQFSVAIMCQVFRGGGLERVTQLLATKLSVENIKVYLMTGPALHDDYKVPENNNIIRLEAFSELDWMHYSEPKRLSRVQQAVKIIDCTQSVIHNKSKQQFRFSCCPNDLKKLPFIFM